MNYHFATQNHSLEELAEQKAVLLTTIPLIEGKELSKMIAENMNKLVNVETVILDCFHFYNQESEIHAAWELITELGLHAAIVFLIRDEAVEDTIKLRDGYTILNMAHRDVTNEIGLCLSGERLKEEIKSIWIGVVSAKSGVGATTLAMQLTSLLAIQEAKTCYVEATGSNQLEDIATWYHMEQADAGGYMYQGAYYVSGGIREDMVYNIIDLGLMSSRKLKMLNACKIKIMVADATPAGVGNLIAAMKWQDDINGRLQVCMNFSDMNERENILEHVLVHDGELRVHFNEYNPCYFSVVGNEMVLKRLVSSVITIPDTEKPEVYSNAYDYKKVLTSMLRYKMQIGMVVCCLLISIIAIGIMMNRKSLAEPTETTTNTEIISAISTDVVIADNSTDIMVVSTEVPTEVMTEASTEISSETSTEVSTEVTTETSTEVSTEVTTEVSTEASTEVSTEATTEAATDVTTEEASTEQQVKGIAKYDQTFVSGSQLKKIIKKYGKKYSITVETRNNGVLNYGLAGHDNVDWIENKVSYYAILTYNGEDITGLYLLQQ